MSLLTASDFIGAYFISEDNFSEFDNYIDQFEQMYIRSIVGDYNATKMTDLGTMEQRYLDLWNGVNYTNSSSNLVINSGMKKALVGFIYFHYISDDFTQTNVGNVINSNENSTNNPKGVNAAISINRFNTSIMQVRGDVNNFLIYYRDITTISTGSSEVATDYTVLIPTTEYLEVGDTINVGGVDYTVTAVDPDVSFNITATTGMDFNDMNVIWYPFNQNNINELKMIIL